MTFVYHNYKFLVVSSYKKTKNRTYYIIKKMTTNNEKKNSNLNKNFKKM